MIEYFNGAILKNTSGTKLDVDNFLNKNLNIILNDQRNIQLNKHSSLRFKPFLLNYPQNLNSSFPSVVPYKPDNSFAFELQDELDSMREAQKITEYGSTSLNSTIEKYNES